MQCRFDCGSATLAVDALTSAPKVGDIFKIASASATAKVNGAISNTTSLVVDNNSGTIAVGMTITGTNINETVHVRTVTDQNNLVLSKVVTLSDNVDLTFTRIDP